MIVLQGVGRADPVVMRARVELPGACCYQHAPGQQPYHSVFRVSWRCRARSSLIIQFQGLLVLPCAQQHHLAVSGSPGAAARAGKFSCFGELMSQPSRLAPNAAMDATVGQLIAEGLATSATVLVSNLLRTAAKCARRR